MRMASHKNQLTDYNRAKNLRGSSSPFEQKLWSELQQLYKTAGIKFRRQQPLSPYIADFACMKAKLVVELDGSSHDNRWIYDERRDAYLQGMGYTILRFPNNEVASNLKNIVTTIVEKTKELLK